MKPTRAAIQWNPLSKKTSDSLALSYFGTEQGGGAVKNITLFSALSSFFFTCDPHTDLKRAHITSKLQPPFFFWRRGGSVSNCKKSDPQSIWLSSELFPFYREKKETVFAVDLFAVDFSEFVLSKGVTKKLI